MRKRIARFDHREQYRAIRREILEAIDQVLESETLILGPKVAEFERQMVQFLGCAGQGVGVASGTDALAIALRAMEIGPGDEVITVAHTAVGTVSAIRMVGAKPVFCEIDPQTLVMDPRDAARRVSRNTRAIIPVHLYGNAVDMREITRLAAGYGLKVIEDCAQSCGTLLHGRATGTWGDVGCFSFYPTKNLAAYGDAGLCFSRDRTLADAMRAIRSYGSSSDQSLSREGVNSRLDEMQAAVLEVKMRYLPIYLQRRRKVAETYRQFLDSACSIPVVTAGTNHSHHLFVIRVERRSEVMAHLQEIGIECAIHYATPVHRMGAFQHLGYAEGSLPITERVAREVLSLPCYPELPLESVEQICSTINDVLQSC